MQQPQAGALPQYVQPQFVMVPVAQTQRNGLGAFAFFLALIGLIVPTGIVAVLALMLGLAAIGRSPRGFATGAVILGLLGSAFWLVVMVGLVAAGLVGAIAGTAFLAASFAIVQPEPIEITSDMVNAITAVEAYEREHGELPAGLEVLSLGVAASTDPWGGAYMLVRTDDDRGVDVVSGGPDGAFDTDDDVSLSGLDRVWEQAFESFDERMEELGNRLERLDRGGSMVLGGSCSVRSEDCDDAADDHRGSDRVSVYRRAAERVLERREASAGD